jgi:uncharacterized membrane protein YczE
MVIFDMVSGVKLRYLHNIKTVSGKRGDKLLKKTIIFRAASYFIGLFIISIAISLTIKANLGAGSWDALNVGLSQTIGFTVGTWVILVGIMLIILNALLMKKKPDLYALITIVIVGSLIDFWLLFILGEWQPEPFFNRFFILIFAIILLAVGVSTYLQADFAPVPIDNLMLAIQYRTGLNLMIAKTVGELCALVLAFIFGGPIGLGTILITFGLGPLIQFFYPKFERLIKQQVQHI